MDATDIANIKAEMIRQYGLNPSVTITQVASGGSLGTLQDTRMQSGTAATSTGIGDNVMPPETSTGEPTQITPINYARMTETVATLSATADTNNRAFPVFMTAGGDIQAMTLQDMYDTFVNDVINTLTTAATTSSQAGTYRIHTATTLTGHTLVSATPIFLDTVADIGDVDGATAFLAANIGTAGTVQDIPVTRTSYYLFSINGATVGTIPTPLYITAAPNNHLQQFTTANFQAQLADLVRYYATQTGSRIDYVLDTSTTGARGSAIVNSTHNGTGLYTTRIASADDYRAQEFPNGTLVTVTTSYLRCVRA